MGSELLERVSPLRPSLLRNEVKIAYIDDISLPYPAVQFG